MKLKHRRYNRALSRRGVRVAYRARLESVCTFIAYRGFESRPLRHLSNWFINLLVHSRFLPPNGAIVEAPSCARLVSDPVFEEISQKSLGVQIEVRVRFGRACLLGGESEPEACGNVFALILL